MVDYCQAAFSAEKARRAGELGAELLSAAGEAVEAFNAVPLEKLGYHLIGAKRGLLRGVSALHQEYLRQCAQEGVPRRREQPLRREEAKNHWSVCGYESYEEELLQKAWKDAAYGAALSIAPGSDEIEKMLSDAGVAESPLGRVSKQNPDRTISSEGRPITDMRRQNEAGSKFNHPPAPQPRHHAVARQSLWWKARRPASRRCATGF